MSQSTILTLLPQTPYNNDGTGNAYSVTGNSVQAAGYILGGQDLQTLTYNFSEVTGNLIIEGTLASTPADGDWFEVFHTTANNSSNVNSNTNLIDNIKDELKLMFYNNREKKNTNLLNGYIVSELKS